MSLREVSKHLERFGIDRSHVAIHNWVHKADLQPISTVSEDQIAEDISPAEDFNTQRFLKSDNLARAIK